MASSKTPTTTPAPPLVAFTPQDFKKFEEIRDGVNFEPVDSTKEIQCNACVVIKGQHPSPGRGARPSQLRVPLAKARWSASMFYCIQHVGMTDGQLIRCANPVCKAWMRKGLMCQCSREFVQREWITGSASERSAWSGSYQPATSLSMTSGGGSNISADNIINFFHTVCQRCLQALQDGRCSRCGYDERAPFDTQQTQPFHDEEYLGGGQSSAYSDAFTYGQCARERESECSVLLHSITRSTRPRVHRRRQCGSPPTHSGLP